MSVENIAKWISRPLKPHSVSEVLELGASVGTTIGDVRKENQDRAVVARYTSVQHPEKSFVCYGLCDGMGGMTEGGRCAEIALSTFLFRLTQVVTGSAEEAVRSAAIAANTEVNRRYRERGGTTLVAFVIFPESAAAVSIGDSRIYEIGPQKELTQISSDDTIVGQLNRLVGMNSSDSGWDTFAGQLAQYVGLGEGIEPRVYPINRDRAYLLTSDGIHGYGMSPETLRQFVASCGTTHLLVSRLITLSRWCGGRDNATALCSVPIRPDWFIAPSWTTGEWIEIWDSVGKTEFPVSQQSLHSPILKEPYERIGYDNIKPMKSRKRPSLISKKAPRTLRSDVHSSPEQGNLVIEIVDEKLPETTSGEIKPSDSPEMQPESLKGEQDRRD